MRERINLQNKIVRLEKVFRNSVKQNLRKQKIKNSTIPQQRVKKIAGKSQFTKVLADFLSVNYLLTLVLKTSNFPYTTTLAVILLNLK